MARDEAKWAHWAQVIHDWRASGLTRNAYCPRPLFGRREGINVVVASSKSRSDLK